MLERESATEMKFSELQMGENKGRFLRAKIASEVSRAVGITFAASPLSGDPRDGVMTIALYNIEILFSPTSIARRLAIGREITIYNPFVKQFNSGEIGVRVDDPTTLEFAVVEPRCFNPGCEKKGVSKCSRCKLVTCMFVFCARVGVCKV